MKQYYMMDLHGSRKEKLSFWEARQFLLNVWENSDSDEFNSIEEYNAFIKTIEDGDIDTIKERMEGIGYMLFDSPEELKTFEIEWNKE